MKKTWIKIKRGFLQPAHRSKMGIRVWLYMFIIDQADWDTGIVYDWTDKNAADELGMPIGTLRQQRQELETLRYINCYQEGNHQKITILKWVDPRSYSGEVMNNSEGTNEGEVEGTDKGTETSVPLHSTHKSLIINHKDIPAKNAGTLEYEPFDQQSDMPESMAHEYDPPKKVKKEKQQPDPRYTHPAYQLFYAITSRRPNKELVDQIIDILGEHPEGERAKKCQVEWIARGYNPNSIKWLDWYVSGIPGYAKKTVQSKNDEILQRFMENANGNG